MGTVWALAARARAWLKLTTVYAQAFARGKILVRLSDPMLGTKSAPSDPNDARGRRNWEGGIRAVGLVTGRCCNSLQNCAVIGL